MFFLLSVGAALLREPIVSRMKQPAIPGSTGAYVHAAFTDPAGLAKFPA